MPEAGFINDAINAGAETGEDRTKLTDMVTEAASGTAGSTVDGGGPSDASVLNFALNLKYLEAEFYADGAPGQGVWGDVVGRAGAPGRSSAGTTSTSRVDRLRHRRELEVRRARSSRRRLTTHHLTQDQHGRPSIRRESWNARHWITSGQNRRTHQS